MATTYTNALLVYSAGAAKKIASDDTIVIGGNLTVNGTLTTVDTANVLIEDAFLDLGYGNTSTSNRALGFTFNVSAVTSSIRTGAVSFTAGVVATSAPTITIEAADWSSVYVAETIIQISGASEAENNGLFAVKTVAFSTDTVLTLYGVGGTAVPGYVNFVQNQVKTATSATATSAKVNLAVIGVSDGSAVKNSSGSAIAVGSVVSAYYADALVTDFNGTTGGTGYTALATGGSVTLQGAYDGGPAIILTDTNDLTVSKPTSGTASIELEANKDSSFSVENADLTLDLNTSGYVSATKDFGTVGSGDYDTILDAGFSGLGGNNVQLAIKAPGSTQFSVSTVGDNGGLLKVTTTTAHGLTTGDRVEVYGVTYIAGNNPNGLWTVTVVDSDEFTLDGSDSTAFVYTSGGSVIRGLLGPAAMSVSTIGDNGGLLEVTTTADHGLATGDFVEIRSVSYSAGSNPNGYWKVTKVDANEFTLDGSSSTSFVYTSGGTVSPMIAISTIGNNAGNLEVTTTKPHFLTTGDYVYIQGVSYSAGNDPNGQWAVTVVDADEFVLNDSDSTSFTYTSGGSVGGMFVVTAPSGVTVNVQIKSGITTVGHIDNTIPTTGSPSAAPLAISTIGNSGGQLQVTTSTPHGLSNQQYINISGVTSSGGSEPNGDWPVESVTDTTFVLQQSDSSGFTYTSGGNVTNYAVYGILLVDTAGTSGTVLSVPDTFAATNLAGGVGEGQIVLKRGTVSITPGSGFSGSGAGFIVDSPFALTSDQHAAYVYGVDSVGVISQNSVSINANNPGAGSGQVSISADSDSGQGAVSVRAKNRFNVETTTNSGGQISLQTGGAYLQLQQGGDLRLKAGSQPIDIGTTSNSITISTTTGGNVALSSAGSGDVLLDGAGGVEINSSGDSIQIGNDANNFGINIGSGGARTIQIGRTSSPVIFAQSSSDTAPLGTLLPMVDSDSVTTGQILYITNNSGTPKAVQADANGAGVVRELVGIALENGPGSGTADKKVGTVPGTIMQVLFNSGDLPAGDTDIGNPVYLTTTAGEAGMTAPSSAARVYRVGILMDGTAVTGNIYKVLYLPAFVADLS